MRMADLLRKFKELLSDVGVKSDYRAEKLKKRMVGYYGKQLSFWNPKNRTGSEMVFLADVPKGQIVEAGVQSADTSFQEDEWSRETISVEKVEETSLQHVALIIRHALLQVKSTISHSMRP